MELCLGTAGFGMDYGMVGSKKHSKAEIFEILDYAVKNHLTTLDTSPCYGETQSIIGSYNINHQGSYEIISKLSKDIFISLSSPREYLQAAYHDVETTLQQLWIPYLKGILFHNPWHLYDKNAVIALKELKKSGYTEWIGVSVYEPKDVQYALELGMDLIQLPLKLFDHRFDEVIKNVALYSIVLEVDSVIQLKQNIEEYQAMLPEAFIDKITVQSDKSSVNYLRT